MSGSLFFKIFQLFQKKKKIINAILCNFSMQLLKCLKKKLNCFFALKKLKKTPSKVAYVSRILVVSEIFHNAAQQPKWQKSCFKMWPIDQLYIELGLKRNPLSDHISAFSMLKYNG
jgi:hypothetical protein